MTSQPVAVASLYHRDKSLLLRVASASAGLVFESFLSELVTGFSSGVIVTGLGCTVIEKVCPHSTHFLTSPGNE